MPYLERHLLNSPYHYCSFCWDRFPLSELTWQRGALRCPRDVDTMLIGDRELAIMRVLSGGDAIEELAPDKKLQAPAQSGLIEDIIL
jgi:hypothetical protein